MKVNKLVSGSSTTGAKQEAGLGASSEHYTTAGYKTVENSSNPSLQKYMAVEQEAITSGVKDAGSKTFVDIGAGNGRIEEAMSRVASKVVAIELNDDMFKGLCERTKLLPNVTPVHRNAHDLENILLEMGVQRPVLVLAQNTLAVIGDTCADLDEMPEARRLLEEMRAVAERGGGEIVISLLKQEALESMGVAMYGTFKDMVGEPDFEKMDYGAGLFATKSGYQSKWWRPEEREEIKRILGGRVATVLDGANFWILHVSYADQ